MIKVAYEGVLKEPKTCLLKLVGYPTMGFSDALIKISPSEHENETLWLDNAPQIQRWEAIQDMIDTYREKGTPRVKPANLHSDPKQSISPDLKPEDIPLVRLEGVALKAPPPPDSISYPNQNPPNVLELNKKVADLTAQVSALATALSIAGNKYGPTQKRTLDPNPTEQMALKTCENCGGHFGSVQGKNVHKSRFCKKTPITSA